MPSIWEFLVCRISVNGFNHCAAKGWLCLIDFFVMMYAARALSTSKSALPIQHLSSTEKYSQYDSCFECTELGVLIVLTVCRSIWTWSG